MTKAIKEVMKNNNSGNEDSRKIGGGTAGRHRLVTSSFSPMSNRSRSAGKGSLGRSSLKKQNTTTHNHNNNGSLLNMSNEVALMRSLSPSIQQQDTHHHNHNISLHKRRNSSLSPYANLGEGQQLHSNGKKSAYNSLTSNGIMFNNT